MPTKKSSIAKFFPIDMLKEKEVEIREIIQASDSVEIIDSFKKISDIFATIQSVVKEELINRLSEAEIKNIETELGKVTLCERANYTYNDKAIQEFLVSNNLPNKIVYDESYALNDNFISSLEEGNRETRSVYTYLTSNNFIEIKLKPNSKKLEKLIVDKNIKKSVVNKMVKNEPTIYLKGL